LQRSGKERERSTSAARFFCYVAPPPRRQHLPFFPLSLSLTLHTHIHQQQHRKATKKKSIVVGKSQQRQPTEGRMQPRNSPSFRHKQHKQTNETKRKQKAKDENRSTKHTHAHTQARQIHKKDIHLQQ